MKSGRSSTASTGDVWLKLATRQNMVLVTGASSRCAAVGTSQQSSDERACASAPRLPSASGRQLSCGALLPAADCQR